MENERTRCINCMWKIAREGGRVNRRGNKSKQLLRRVNLILSLFAAFRNPRLDDLRLLY